MSFGNACDVNENDVLSYYAQEPSVEQVWTYMEGFHDGGDFVRRVRQVTPRKPVVMIKANRSDSGAKASSSHSASLAANDAVTDQLLRNVSVGRLCVI